MLGFTPHSLSPAELAAIAAAEGGGRAFVAHRDALGDLRLHVLDDAERITVGRGEHNALELGWDAEVSRTHAHLESVGPEWSIVDDGLSHNGSFVNGERLTGRRRLVDGDVLRLGRTTLVYRAPRPPAPSTVTTDGGASVLARVTDAEHRVLVALCRPLATPGGGGAPATNREIADELQLSLAGVKTHVRALFAKLAIDDLPQYRKRTELAQRALAAGLVTARSVAASPQRRGSTDARPIA